MASLCVSRTPAIQTPPDNTPIFLQFAIFDYLRVSEIQVTPRNKAGTLRGMSLKLQVGAGAYRSTISTATSVSRLSQTSFSEPASQYAALSDSEEDVLSASDAQEYRSQATYATETGLPQSSFVTQLDPEVEALTMRINESVVIRDVATKNPQSIIVPRGFLFENEIKPTRFYETRGQIRDHVKKRKREGVLPKKSKKQWRNERHGFRAHEVHQNGAVHLEGCRPSNLTNNIHPIFDRSNFGT